MTIESMRDVRDSILDRAIGEIAFDGLSWPALEAGAVAAGLDRHAARRAFPDGFGQAAAHMADMADRRMEDAFHARVAGGMGLGARVELALMIRFEQWQPHKEAVRRASAVLALPQNAALAARTTWRTADAVWHTVGDTSVDFNYYTKRASLAAIYSATVFAWFTDDTPDNAITRDFLRRRLKMIGRLPNLGQQFNELGGRLEDLFDRFRPPSLRRNPFAQ